MNNSLSEKNIVVTGGLGKIGQIICNYLHNENANVIVLARLASKPSNIIDQYSEKMDLINCDLSDVDARNTAQNLHRLGVRLHCRYE